MLRDVTCPVCDAEPGVPCAKMGELVAFVSGPSYHKARWEAKA